MAEIKPYSRLGDIYDKDWGLFPERFAEIILPLYDKKSLRTWRVLDLACGTGILALRLFCIARKI